MGNVTFIVDFQQERAYRKMLEQIERVSLAGVKERTCLRVVIEGGIEEQWDQQEILEGLRHFRWTVKVLSSGETASTGQAEARIELHEACTEESNHPWLEINVEPLFPGLDPTDVNIDRVEIALTTQGGHYKKFRSALPSELEPEKPGLKPPKLRLVESW